MKFMNLTFTDREFNRLKKAKAMFDGKVRWELFFLWKCAKGIDSKAKIYHSRPKILHTTERRE